MQLIFELCLSTQVFVRALVENALEKLGGYELQELCCQWRGKTASVCYFFVYQWAFLPELGDHNDVMKTMRANEVVEVFALAKKLSNALVYSTKQ